MASHRLDTLLILNSEDQSIQLPTMCLPGDYLNLLEHLYIYFPQVKFQLEFRKPCLTQNGLRQ